jgi:hypothetical protein
MSDNWIEKMHMKSGALHKDLGVSQGDKISSKKISGAMKSKDPTEKKRAVLANTLAKFH